MNLQKTKTKIKSIPVFPNDFLCKPHKVAEETKSLGVNPMLRDLYNKFKDAKQWIYPKKGDVIISIIGGSDTMYGDGITTFEMYDLRENAPQGYLTKEEINEHLKNNPI